MTNLLERGLHSCRIAAAMSLSLLLIACGPGVGGTGTGSPVTVPAGGVDIAVYTGEINCTTGCEGIELDLAQGSVTMFTRCNFFLAEADWMVDAEGSAAIPGRFQTSATGPFSAATLELHFSSPSADRQQVTATLVNEAGEILIGETTLQRSQDSGYAVTGSCH